MDVHGVPVEESDCGWLTLRLVRVKLRNGVELQRVTCNGGPGSLFRIRTTARRGRCYDATIWNFHSKGIERSFDLSGHDIGGDLVKEVKFQVLDRGLPFGGKLECVIHGD